MMNSRRQIFLLSFFLLLFPLQLSANPLEKIEVFVSLPPQKWLCEQIGQEFISVRVLIEKGQEPHTFEPSPHQILELSRSSLLFASGMSFEQGLMQRMGQNFLHFRIVNTAEKIHKIPMQGMPGHQGELDPHVWLSPENLKIMAVTMAEALSVEDPQHIKEYESNLQKIKTQLDDLDHEITARLAPFRGASFLVFHPAFGYFAHRYSLHQVAVETGGKSPTPKKLAALIRKAREENIRIIFVQPQFDPRSANVVAAAINGKVAPMDPLAENVAANLRTMSEKIVEGIGKRLK